MVRSLRGTASFAIARSISMTSRRKSSHVAIVEYQEPRSRDPRRPTRMAYSLETRGSLGDLNKTKPSRLGRVCSQGLGSWNVSISWTLQGWERTGMIGCESAERRD